MDEITEDRWLSHLRSTMEEVVDQAVTYQDWSRFKRALARWVEEQDAGWDEVARDEEHGTER